MIDQDSKDAKDTKRVAPSKEILEATEEGKAAYRRGLEQVDCPYDQMRELTQYAHWINGWRIAKFEEKNKGKY